MSGDEPEGDNEYEKIEEYQIINLLPAAEERWGFFLTFVLRHGCGCMQRRSRCLLGICVVTSYK
jgi:hypothetical protein